MPLNQTKIPELNRLPNPGNHTGEKYKVNYLKAFRLKFEHGLSYAEVAKQLDCTRNAIYQGLKPISNLLESATLYPVYTGNESQLLKITESLLLQNMLDEDRLKKASVNNLAYALDKVRAARAGTSGKGTSVKIEMVFQEAQKQAKEIRQNHADIIINKRED